MTVCPEIKLKTCFDACGARGDEAPGSVLRGWNIAPSPIRAVNFRWPDGETANVVLPCAWHQIGLGCLATGATVREIFFCPDFEAGRAYMLQPDGDPGCLGCPIKSSHLPTTRHG